MAKIAHVNYGQLIKRRWSFVTVVTLVVVLLSLVFTLVRPFEYQSEVKILVIQKSAINIDAYSASKSAERIGRNLSQVIYSSSFYSKVINAGFGVDRDYFEVDENKRRKQWQDMISAEVPAGTTILDIKVFHRDRDQATRIAQATAYVLDLEAEDYVGVPDIDLKVVDAPLTSKFPIKPNFILNLSLGLALGLFLAIATLLVTYTEAQEAEQIRYQQLAEHRRELKKQRRLSGVRNARKSDKKTIVRPIQLPPVNAPDLDVTPDSDEEYYDEPGLRLPGIKTDIDSEEHDLDLGHKNLPAFKDEGEIKTMK